MIPYYILIFIPLIIYLIGLRKGKKYDIFCIVLFFLIFIILLSLRGIETGTDLKAYLNIFTKISNLPFNSLLNYFEKDEILFYFLNKFIFILGGNFQFFLLVCALFSVLPILFLYKKESDNAILVISLFLVIAPFPLYFSGLRQVIAMGIVVIAFNSIKSKKLIKYILLIITASLFHKSAIFCLLLYPLYHARITNKWLYFVVPIMTLIFVFRTQIFSAIFQFISTGIYESYNYIKPTGAYSILILLILFCAYSYLIPDKNKINKDYIGLRNFLLLAVCIQFFASINFQMMRINYYILLFIPLLIPKVKEYCKKGNTKLVNLLELVMIAFFVFSFFYKGYVDNDVLNIFPYIPFWEV